jgi:hypothetical protein
VTKKTELGPGGDEVAKTVATPGLSLAERASLYSWTSSGRSGTCSACPQSWMLNTY